jgi:tetratricopeptide (TPR) repeat protein
MRWKKRSTAILAALLLVSSPAYGQMPYAKGFGSSVSANLGMQLDLRPLFEKVNTTSVYRIDEKDNEHLRWRLGSKGTPDSVIVFRDGRVQVGSRSKFDPSAKDRLDAELAAAIKLLNATWKVPDAIQYYSEDNSVDAEGWGLCGDQVYKTWDYARSLIYYNKSIELDHSNAVAWNNKGAALANLGRYPEAIVCYDKAINASQDSSISWDNKGLAFYYLGRADEALDCLNRSSSKDEGNALAWYNRGVLLSGKARYEEALESYDRSIDADLYFAEAWNNKGLALVKLGRSNESLDCFINAANLNQRYAQAWVNGGLVLKTLGLEAKAKDAFLKAEWLGYKGSKEYQWAGMTPPELVAGSSKSIPGAWGVVTVTAILMAGLFTRRRCCGGGCEGDSGKKR